MAKKALQAGNFSDTAFVGPAVILVKNPNKRGFAAKRIWYAFCFSNNTGKAGKKGAWAARKKAKPGAAMENKKPFLIIAEKNLNVAGLLLRLFEEQGWQAAVAGNGRDAWRLCRGEAAPRLIIIDEEIENPSSAALMEKIRLFRPEIPIILHVFPGTVASERLRALATKVVEKSGDTGNLLRAANRLGLQNIAAKSRNFNN